ncbi:MAG: WD40 repeat domain-containing protein [Verrucomicrobia bacterium]|nr:WD40 repeat domain-containing protein [Verrucomicrobiota bacterium]
MNLAKHWAATLDDYVIDLGWSSDGSLLATASAAGPVSLFAADDGAKTATLPGHDDGTNCLTWHPSQPLLATGGQDGKVKFWDAPSAQHTASAELGGAWVEHLAWRSAGSTAQPSQSLLAAAAGRNLAVFNPDGSTRHAFPPAPKTISALAWQPAGGALAAAYFGGVCLWDADDFVVQKEFAYANGIHALVWSPDNRWLVSGNQDPSVHLWLPEQNDEFHMSGYESKVKELSFDRDSHWLATGGGRDACLWDCTGKGPEGREPTMLPHEAKVCAVAFQHTHGLLATASQDGTLHLWSPERKQPLRATVKMPAPATKLAWSPDDRLLAVGSEKGIVYVLKCEG